MAFILAWSTPWQLKHSPLVYSSAFHLLHSLQVIAWDNEGLD